MAFRASLVALATVLLHGAFVTAAVAQAIPSYVFRSALLPRIVQMPANSWAKVNANFFSDVWTTPDLEPLDFNGVTHTPSKIILAWSGFAWDSNRGDLIIYGGGHANYTGNDVYRWHSSTLDWERAALPSEIKFDPVAGTLAVDGPDHAPVAAHTYDNNVFLPIADRFLTFGGASYNTDGGPYRRISETNPSTWRPTGPYLFDPNRANGNEVGGTTGSHVQRVAPHPEIVGGQMWQNRDVPLHFAGQVLPQNYINGCSAAAIEGGRDVVYVMGSTKSLYRYQLTSLADPTQDQMTMAGGFENGTAGQTACGYDPVRKLFVRLGTNAQPFSFWDLTSPGPTNYDKPVAIESTIAGLQSWLSANGLDIQNCGFKFDANRQTYLLWCGAGTLWTLNAPATNAASGWSVTKVSPGGTPPPGNLGTGIIGKWRYAPYYDVFVGLEDITEGQIWIYKPAGWVQPNATGNVLPTVAMTAPANGATIAPGVTVNLTANASDADGTISRVEYYINGEKFGTATAAPYTLAWTPLLVGNYQLSAVAVDNAGGMRVSPTISVSVSAPITSVVLQDGRAGYAAAADTYLYSFASTTPNGASDLIYVDGWSATGLLRFAIFQSEGGSVPDGAVIQSATLSLYKQYYDSEMRLNALLVPWAESTATWQNRMTGTAWAAPGAAGAGSDYASSPDVVMSGSFNPGWFDLDVTSRLRQWSANASTNQGWRLSLSLASAPALQFRASEYAADPTLRPKLAIVYAPPVTNNPPAGASVNVALAGNGAVATASSTLRAANAARYVNDGQRSGAGWTTGGGGWADATPGAFPDWVEIDFAGTKTIDHVVLYSVQDNFQNPVEPTDTTTFSLYGMTAFDVQAWTGSSWTPLAQVTGNRLVKRTVTFQPYTTNRIRVVMNGVADNRWSRVTEIEAWTSTSSTTDANFALAANGGVANASSTLRAANIAAYVNDGQRSGAGWSTGGGGWADATPGLFPDYVEIDLASPRTLDHVVVYSVQDNFQNPVEPTDSTTFSLYGLTAFDVQAAAGTQWVTLASVAGNNLVKRTVTFAPFTTSRLRIVVRDVADHRWSRITEIEAFGH
jgi:hypothetical protein